MWRGGKTPLMEAFIEEMKLRAKELA